MNGLHFLFIGIALSMMLLVTGCNTPYITNSGERLLSNSVVGCAVGQVFFDDCDECSLNFNIKGAGATIIDDQTK